RSAWKHQREALDVFEAFLPFARVRLQKTNFLMSHLPYIGGGDHTPEERHTQYRLMNEGMPLLCGHVHDAWKFNGNQFNVGVDVNDFEPVTSATVLEWGEGGSRMKTTPEKVGVAMPLTAADREFAQS